MYITPTKAGGRKLVRSKAFPLFRAKTERAEKLVFCVLVHEMRPNLYSVREPEREPKIYNNFHGIKENIAIEYIIIIVRK